MPAHSRPRPPYFFALLLILCGQVLSLSSSVALAAPADDEYTLGITLYGQKRWDLAAETLKNYLETYPDHENVPLGKVYLAQSYVNQQKYAEARTILRDFLKAHPQNKNAAQAQYRVAECSYFLDDYKAAIKDFQAFLDQNPNDALSEWALPYLADSYLRDGQPGKAELSFKQSLQTFPEGRFQEDSLFGLARAYELQNEPKSAIAEYQKLIALPDGDRAAEALVNLGMLYFQQQNYNLAAEVFTLLVKDYPESSLVPLANLNAGYAYYSLNQWDKAIERLELAKTSEAYSATAQYWLAQTYKSQGQIDKAIQQLEELRQNNPSEDLQPRVVYQLADTYFQQASYAKAAGVYQEYLKAFSTGDQAEAAWLHLVESQLLQDQLGTAWATLESPGELQLTEAGERERILLQARLLAESPSQDDPLPEAVGSREERLQRADELLRNLIAEQPLDQTDPLSQQIYFEAARIAQQRQEPQRVVEMLDPLTRKRAAEVSLQLPEAWLLLASALLDLEEYDEALKAAEQVPLDQTSERVAEQAVLIRVSAYLALQQFEQAEQAIAELEKIPGGSEKRWQALYQLAESAYAGSAWERAERLYRQIVDAEAPPEWTIKAMSGLGWTLFEAGDFAGAAAAFDKLQQSFPESRQAAADAGYMRGMAELRAERLEQAAGIFMETADKFQADESAEQGDEINYIAYRAAREAARTYRSLANTNKAADAYRVAYQQLSKQPESRQTNLDKLLDEWGLLHYEAGQYDEADAVFRILVEKCPKSDRSDDALLSLAESEYIAGNTVQARTMFEELLALPTADNYVQRRARYQLVLIAAEQKDLAAVQKFAQSYLSETDLADVPLAERGEVESQLVQFHLESGQLEQAKDLIAELLEKAEALEDDVPEWLPGLYVQAAEIARREKNYDRVRELQQTVQQKFPETEARDQIDVLVGRSYIAQANFDQARQTFQAVLDRIAGQKTLAAAQSQFYLAETSLMQKNYEDALKEYIRVAVLFPGFPDLQSAALFQAGQCDEVLGHPTQAIQSYENLRRLYPESEFASRAAERIEKLRQ